VVNLPEKQQRHAGFSDRGIGGTEKAVIADPVCQPRIHLGHGDVLPRRKGRVPFALLYTAAPCTDICSSPGLAIPPDQGAASGLYERRIE